MIEDFDLIVSSFQTQYGLRLSRELDTMKWDEFKDLLVGIGPETPLGRIVSIRGEEDPETLKHFTKDQHKIRNAYLKKKVKEIREQDMTDILEQFKKAFIEMAGNEMR